MSCEPDFDFLLLVLLGAFDAGIGVEVLAGLETVFGTIWAIAASALAAAPRLDEREPREAGAGGAVVSFLDDLEVLDGG